MFTFLSDATCFARTLSLSSLFLPKFKIESFMGQYRNPIQRKMGGIFQLPYIYGFFQGGNFSQCIAELGRTRSVRRLFAYSVRNTNELFFPMPHCLKITKLSPIPNKKKIHPNEFYFSAKKFKTIFKRNQVLPRI